MGRFLPGVGLAGEDVLIPAGSDVPIDTVSCPVGDAAYYNVKTTQENPALAGLNGDDQCPCTSISVMTAIAPPRSSEGWMRPMSRLTAKGVAVRRRIVRKACSQPPPARPTPIRQYRRAVDVATPAGPAACEGVSGLHDHGRRRRSWRDNSMRTLSASPREPGRCLCRKAKPQVLIFLQLGHQLVDL